MTRWEELGMTAEEYVRSLWSLVHHCDGSYQYYPCGTILLQYDHESWLDFGSWHLAAEFTRRQEEEIRLLTYEISLQKLLSSNHESEECKNPHDHRADGDAMLRTIGRLETELLALKKGMKA